MEKEKIHAFLLSKGKCLPMSKIAAISSKMLKIEDESLIYELYSLEFKNPNTYTLLYWLLPGFAFIDRFFVGSFLTGLLKLFMPIIILIGYLLSSWGESYEIGQSMAVTTLFAFGLYFIWILIDGFTIGERVKSYNLDKMDCLTDFNTQHTYAKPTTAKQQNPLPQKTLYQEEETEWECIHCGHRQAELFIYCPKCKLDDNGLQSKI